MLEVDHGISENLKIMQSRSKMKTEYLKYLDKNHGLILYKQINEQSLPPTHAPKQTHSNI